MCRNLRMWRNPGTIILPRIANGTITNNSR